MAELISGTFIWRRVHSLMGLWLVIYLVVHLVTNSQATLWVGDDGIGFINLVNLLEALPYLQVIETMLIGVPLLVHGYWGVKRALTAKTSSTLPFERNRAFRWQRLTSWILLFGIIAHVVQMRFIDMPKKIHLDGGVVHVVRLNFDPGLDSLAKRIGVKLDREGDQFIATARNPGDAMLLMVRETFKSPLMCILYTVFVLAAAFHAFNGLWTSLITWGALLSYRSQRAFLPICWIGVAFLAFLGLAAIWGSYWVNLRN